MDDEIRIISAHTAGRALLVAPSPSSSDMQGEERLGVFLSRAHYEIETTHLDHENDELELDLNLEECLIYRMLHWMTLSDDDVSERSIAYKNLADSKYREVIGDVDTKIQEAINQWDRSLTSGARVQVTGVREPTNWNDYDIY